MNLLSKSIQKELNHFYKLIKAGEFDVHQVSKGAFTQARAKLKHTAFVELSDLVASDFYKHMPWMSWLGHRILSIDGSTMVLPDSPSLREDFSVHAFGSGEREKVISRISQLYDPLNDMIVHATVGKYTDSERELCKTHLSHVQQGDVILFDRGYSAVWLFKVLQSKGAHFVFRLNAQWWKEARQMLTSGVNDKQVEFSVSSNHYQILEEYGIKDKKITCRLISSTLGNGEKIVLCTSLLDDKKYEVDFILDVYKKRWGIEECYKTLKCRLDVENFTGKTTKAVLQDFHVKIFLSNLCSYLTLEQQLQVEKQNEANTRKYSYKINKSFALSNLKDLPIHFFLKENIEKALKAFKELIFKCLTPIRPARRYLRRHTPRKSSKMNYKPL